MKYCLVIICLFFLACKNNTGSGETIVKSTEEATTADQLRSEVTLPFEVYDYDGLEPLINRSDDKLHVVNFWATWCAPCIKELPYFEELQENYKAQNVELLLVRLDFPRQYQSKLVPFLEKRQIKSEVVALDDVDMNRWIPKIDSTWSGAIPATIIYSKTKRKFYEQSFTYEELEHELQQFLN
jgi:thiol-disulfide isomerase/thioredoxin